MLETNYSFFVLKSLLIFLLITSDNACPTELPLAYTPGLPQLHAFLNFSFPNYHDKLV